MLHNASFLLNLLAKQREQLDVKAAKAIYQSFMLHNTRTLSDKLDSFHHRAEAIINRKRETKISLQSVTNANKKRACTIVRACLDNDVIELFKNYVQLIEHSIQTRHNLNLIRLPKTKTENARRRFSFTAAKEFNMLPSEARQMPGNKFKSVLKKHFS